MLTRNSKLSEIYANPIGHDILAKLLLQMGKSEKLLLNPVVGNLKLKTVSKLTSKILGAGFYDTFLTLLNSEDASTSKISSCNDSASITKTWWKEAVFYQIYPRSFCDANGDGIGDLKGIISKLDYLHGLGVTALWLSPVYDSPNDDNGYDIRDYYNIMQEFGTMEDFDLLLSRTHQLGMHLIMDLVVNHTSDEHEWFKKALSDSDSNYRSYYFLKEGGLEPPNNWTSFFSGSAWNHYEKENLWALHLFSRKQIDLNWDNPDLRSEIIKMINFWLDKGVDGFRMDVINYISKANGLPMGDPDIGKLMEFTGVEHYFYGPKLHDYLRQIRAEAFEPHGAFSVGETPGLGMEMCKLVTGEQRKELDMVFSFDHLETPGHVRFDDYHYDLNYFRDYMIDWMEHYDVGSHGNGCWMSLFYNNHDNPKMVSKINPDMAYRSKLCKLLAIMQFTLRGTPFLFQGDELGLTNHAFASIDEITDIESKNMYQELLKTMEESAAFQKILAGTREHSRLMMPWDEASRTAQHVDSGVTDFYKKLIAYRKKHDALIYGDFKVLCRDKDLFYYTRSDHKEQFLVECNLSAKAMKRKKIPEGYQLVCSNYARPERELQAYEASIYKI